MTTQDLDKGIDLTGLTNVSASELMQLVDSGRLGSDKGMIIEKEDTALDTPLVPNPNNSYTGITPLWWKRYIWKRILFDSSVKCYIWNENEAEDDTLFFWTLIDKAGVEALILANTAITNSAAAQATANTALANAAIADTKADDAQTDADTANVSATATAAGLVATNSSIASMWSAGDLKYTCKTTAYSIIENQGWLDCDGSLVNRLIFSSLFAAIGTTWGAGDGVLTFQLPDFRGRCLVGRGTGAGLTARNLGLTNFGEETHLLTADESGLPAHTHAYRKRDEVNSTGYSSGGSLLYNITIDGVTVANATAPANAAHNNCQPSAVGRILIKT